jgi:DNA (cytosine-5)-methyltransferase 1
VQQSYKVLDLFSGIGGFSLGLQRAGGFETIAFCEIEEFCREVLNKHWPNVPVYEDVCDLTADRLAADGIFPDVLTGGFPSQDISVAGKGAGLSGERSGLWYEFHRLIEEIQPKWAIIENVSALRGRGLDQVLGSLAEIGYDAEWHCIPASAVGAPHQRDRIWIVAHSSCELPYWSRNTGTARWHEFTDSGQTMADSDCPRLERWLSTILQECAREWTARSSSPPNDGGSFDNWLVEPDVGRVADGVPSRVDRLRALGNALVPQIPEMIGNAILSYSTDDFDRISCDNLVLV